MNMQGMGVAGPGKGGGRFELVSGQPEGTPACPSLLRPGPSGAPSRGRLNGAADGARHRHKTASKFVQGAGVGVWAGVG